MSIPKLKDLLIEKDYNKPPRKVGGVAIVSEGQILLVKRSESAGKYPNFWSVPMGGVEKGETFREGAARELQGALQMEVGGEPRRRSQCAGAAVDEGGHGEPRVDPHPRLPCLWRPAGAAQGGRGSRRR